MFLEPFLFLAPLARVLATFTRRQAHAYPFAADKEKAFAEAFRVLKPGGVFGAVVWKSFELLPLAGALMGAVTGPRALDVAWQRLSLLVRAELLTAAASATDTITDTDFLYVIPF